MQDNGTSIQVDNDNGFSLGNVFGSYACKLMNFIGHKYQIQDKDNFTFYNQKDGMKF